MGVALAVVPVVLAAVFAAAGSSKLRRSETVLLAFEKFAVPPFLRKKGVAIALSLGEIFLGAALVLAQGWVFTVVAVIAAAATISFVLVTARALARGEEFDCGCFGASQTPISLALVLRNVALFAAAVACVYLGSTGFEGVIAAIASSGPGDATWAGVTLFLLALSTTFFYSTRGAGAESQQQSRDGYFTDSMMPDLYLTTAGGDPVRLLDMLSSRAHLIVMVRPSCRTCAEFLEDTSPLQARLTPGVGLLLVVSGDQETFTREHPGLAPISLFAGWPLTSYLRSAAYPSAVLIGSDGRILAEPVAGAVAILQLAANSAALQN